MLGRDDDVLLDHPWCLPNTNDDFILTTEFGDLQAARNKR
jgi:hypothetical protein